MSATTASPLPASVSTDRPGIPFARLVRVELRKMFDTRAGRWLMISIVVLSLIAAVSVIAFAPDSVISYAVFATALTLILIQNRLVERFSQDFCLLNDIFIAAITGAGKFRPRMIGATLCPWQ